MQHIWRQPAAEVECNLAEAWYVGSGTENTHVW